MRRSGSVPWILLMLSILRTDVLGDAPSRDHQRHHQPPWNLPPVSSSAARTSRAFLQECESLAVFLERLRGGQSDQGYPSGSDDPYSRRQSPPAYRGDDRFSEDRYHEDQFDDNTYRDEGFPSAGRRSYEQDYDYYDDRGSSPRRSDSRNGSSAFSALPSFLKEGNKQLGFTLLTVGSLFTMFGMTLMFNKTLMRLGNLMFIAGATITMGPQTTMGYFLRPQKARATACIVLGMFLVFVGWPVFGLVLEIFGLLNIFGNLFPWVGMFAKQMPIVRTLLSNNNNRSRRDERREEKQYDYDDQPPWDDGGRPDDERYF